MRILISAGPMFGHVNTVLPLAIAAHEHGHDVVVATGPRMVSHVEAFGLTTWPVGTGEPLPSGASVQWLEYFVESANRRAEDLVPRAVAWCPDVVVHEETELAGAIAAGATGARHLVHGLGLMPPIRIWEALAPGVNRLFDSFGVDSTAEAVRDATYLDLCPPSLQPTGEAVWWRVEALRPLAGLTMPGQTLPSAIGRLPHDRTTHLTLGTVFHDAKDVLDAAISGLRDLPINLVVTVGPGGDPSRFGPQPSHVVLAPYVPHTLLLPQCHLVVSHGGAGIMFGALANGLPHLVLPQGADQDINAEACVRAGAGLSLGRGEVTPSVVRLAAQRLLGEPKFTEAAAAVKSEIQAMPSADSKVSTWVAPAQARAC